MPVSFSKINLTKIDPETEPEHWLTGVKVSLSETVDDENGKFLYAKEKTVNFRNFFAHEDLCNLFNRLRSHMALICELYPKWDEIKNERQLDDPAMIAPSVYVNGVAFTGSDENAGVVLTGFKRLLSDKQLNLVTPNINLGAGEYQWSAQLLELLDEIEAEAGAAYLKKKRKVIQGSLFEDEEGEGGPDDEGVQDDNMKAVFKGGKGTKKEPFSFTLTEN